MMQKLMNKRFWIDLHNPVFTIVGLRGCWQVICGIFFALHFTPVVTDIGVVRDT
ncbi:hypothetical protein [Nitrosomonas sp. Nm33]|uniref:hypothetical protein n=1 Tax=Nitrosomonas sp. Nm33 TaxID=133724 RepID=UPI0015A3B3C5|nr:hypothetical protein [Nitrosomonas sp. Nm33]